MRVRDKETGEVWPPDTILSYLSARAELLEAAAYEIIERPEKVSKRLPEALAEGVLALCEDLELASQAVGEWCVRERRS